MNTTELLAPSEVTPDFKAPPRVIEDKEGWEQLRRAKLGPCRCCGKTGWPLGLHHIVPKSQLGDDLPWNLVPLCGSGSEGCHGLVENRDAEARSAVRESLTEAEVAYVAGKRGLEWLDVNYARLP
jgi:hypothetical protein